MRKLKVHPLWIRLIASIPRVHLQYILVARVSYAHDVGLSEFLCFIGISILQLPWIILRYHYEPLNVTLVILGSIDHHINILILVFGGGAHQHPGYVWAKDDVALRVVHVQTLVFICFVIVAVGVVDVT